MGFCGSVGYVRDAAVGKGAGTVYWGRSFHACELGMDRQSEERKNRRVAEVVQRTERKWTACRGGNGRATGVGQSIVF